jgi:hypothetical protein
VGESGWGRGRVWRRGRKGKGKTIGMAEFVREGYRWKQGSEGWEKEGRMKRVECGGGFRRGSGDKGVWMRVDNGVGGNLLSEWSMFQRY